MLTTILLIGSAATAAILFMGQSRDAHKSAAPEGMAPVATVTAQAVSRIPVVSTVVASGSIAARHTVDIGSELTGLRVTQVNVDEGDFVRKGQILARLNSDVLSAQLSREHANLAGALANVEKAKQPNRLEDILGLQAAYQQAQAAVSQAESNVHRLEASLANLKTIAIRYQTLAGQGAISDQDARDKQTAAQMGESELTATRQQLLMGIVTKNSILLVEYCIMAQHHGVKQFDAIMESASSRMRPILMTTGAMVAGMAPIALGLGAGAEARAPMAIAVIGGLITSTLLTLIVVPVVYSMIDNLQLRLFAMGLFTQKHDDDEAADSRTASLKSAEPQ